MSKTKTYKIDRLKVDSIRKELNLTQEELGKRINESQQTIAKYKWSIPTIENFCQCFNISPSEIVDTPADTLEKEYPEIFESFNKLQEQNRIRHLQENRINVNLITYLESMGFIIKYLRYNETEIDIHYPESIGYIKIEKESNSKLYSIKELHTLENQFIKSILQK